LTNTYFKKSKREEKLRILRRDMLKNLEEVKVASHKKNKSESFCKPHKREFSMFDNGLSAQKIHQKKKASKHYKKEEDFFEFPESERKDENKQDNQT
jgi:hypothetical protein